MAPFPPTAIASSSSALIVASGASLHVYTSSGVTTTTPETVSDAKAHATALVRKVAISSDGALAVTAGDDKALRIWDIAAGKATPRSARIMHKRAAAISFTAANDVIVTDKVGDVYLYPLEPRAAPPAPQGFKLQADPGLNPDADFLLGHVSVVSQHVLAPGGKRIITADRDEHIRVSRFPLAYVIDKYLFGSEGFVSAIHIPTSRPALLISAGGEPTLQLWDWEAGKLLSRIPMWPAVLPHRRIRPALRRIKGKGKLAGAGTEDAQPSDDPFSPGFYVAPEGSMYPTGQGVCIEQIGSVDVGSAAVALFFSEGCNAIHSFVIPETPEDEGAETPTVHTQALAHPVLGFAPVPGTPNQIAVTLDAQEDAIVVVEVVADGSLTLATSPVITTPLATALATQDAPESTLATLALYPNLSLFPRWPGFEEDEQLAGTGEDFESMNPRQLGRLKAQGADVPAKLLSRKAKKRKTEGGEAKEVEAEGAETKETTEVAAEAEAAPGA